ncbi:MAG TPA: class I SAM-dependent methyltransferase [Chloroflexia bacterium]|nr:class I SAM-dependent methyltransferase [Chloroflexia bacterium]
MNLSATYSSLRRWLRFTRLYLGKPPWDTDISPPELVAVVEGPQALPPGRALDLGCGTGTNVIYMAQHGWQATGVDFVLQAIRLARKKAGLAGMKSATSFYRSSVTKLAMLQPAFDLLLDIGCLHSLPQPDRLSYASEVKRLSHKGSLYLLYAFGPGLEGTPSTGLDRAAVERLFEPEFKLVDYCAGSDTGSGRPSAWYTLRRN